MMHVNLIIRMEARKYGDMDKEYLG